MTCCMDLCSSCASKSTRSKSCSMSSPSCKEASWCDGDPYSVDVVGLAPSSIWGENTRILPLWYVLVTLGLCALETSSCLLDDPTSMGCTDMVWCWLGEVVICVFKVASMKVSHVMLFSFNWWSNVYHAMVKEAGIIHFAFQFHPFRHFG